MTNPFEKLLGRFRQAAGRSRRPEAAPESPTDRPDVPPTVEELHAIRVEDYVGTDQATRERIVREGFTAKAKKFLRRLPMAEEVVALYFCMLDPATPLWVKGTIAGALAYFIVPLDAIPDLLPMFGMSDDAAILAAAMAAVTAYITDEHRRKAREWMEVEEIDPAPVPEHPG